MKTGLSMAQDAASTLLGVAATTASQGLKVLNRVLPEPGSMRLSHQTSGCVSPRELDASDRQFSTPRVSSSPSDNPSAFDFTTVIKGFQDLGNATGTLQLTNRVFDALGSKGVLQGDIGLKVNSEVRYGFFYMAGEGAYQAVARDLSGVIGGFAALSVGNFSWLARSLPSYRQSMEYVFDKSIHGEAQPESDFPIGQVLASLSRLAIQHFPAVFLQALRSGDASQVARAMVADAGPITTLLATFPWVEYQVIYDVFIFVQSAYREVGDSQLYSLCALAIMRSDLSDDEKDDALDLLRETAPKPIVEFEYYIPVMVPIDGTPDERAIPRNAKGEKIDSKTVATSVFQRAAIHRAQSITSELLSLYPFLWLYRDESRARAANLQETVRKFGPEVAHRIAGQPLYPPEAAEIAELTCGGPRSDDEIDQILVKILRYRGLPYVANKLAGVPTG